MSATEKKPAVLFVNRKRFGERLLEIRRAKFKDKDSAFQKETNIAPGNYKRVAEGRQYLNLDRLERWLKVCGTSLSSFFADWEREAGEDPSPIRIVPEFRDAYADLTKLLESGDKVRIDSVINHLRDAAEAAASEAAALKAAVNDASTPGPRKVRRPAKRGFG